MKQIKNLSVKNKIIIAIAMMTLISSLTIAGFSWFMNSKLIEEEATNKLKLLCQNYSDTFDMNIVHANKMMDILQDGILEKLDYKQIRNPEYLSKIVNSLNPLVKSLAQNSTNGKTAYVYFNSQLCNQAFDIYYADEKDNGNVVRQKTVPKEYYLSYNNDKFIDCIQ